jgi:hypothetical protein
MCVLFRATEAGSGVRPLPGPRAARRRGWAHPSVKIPQPKPAAEIRPLRTWTPEPSSRSTGWSVSWESAPEAGVHHDQVGATARVGEGVVVAEHLLVAADTEGGVRGAQSEQAADGVEQRVRVVEVGGDGRACG